MIERMYRPLVALIISACLSGVLSPPSASTRTTSTAPVPAGQRSISEPTSRSTVYLPTIFIPPGKTVSIYTEWPTTATMFLPLGWMGDTTHIAMALDDQTHPYGGTTAIRAHFSPGGARGWAGVSWQDPRSDWGKRPGGHDLRGAGRLSFWARGAQGGEVVEFSVGGIGLPTTPYSDTIQPARITYPIVLANQWERIEVDLTGAKLDRVVGVFAWSASSCQNRQPITFYLDDIVLEYTPIVPDTPLQLPRRFYVYDDYNSGCTHFAPSGLMGDIEDVTINSRWRTNPYRGPTAIRAEYSAQGSRGKGWAGLVWQEPEHNWGQIPGGFDLWWANKLTFRARGERGGETAEFFIGGIGADSDPYPDSLRPALSTGPISLTLTWQTYTLDLRGKDLSRIIGGFGWAATQKFNPTGATFYVDDIRYEYDPAMPLPVPMSQARALQRTASR